MTNIKLLLPLAWMAGIFVLSSIPDIDQPTNLAEQALHWVSPQLQNILHIPLYFGLAMSWLWALGERQKLGHRLMTTAVVAGSWALLDEYHQLFVPGRFGSWTDVVLDEIGVLAGLAVTAVNEKKAVDAHHYHNT